MKGDKFKQVVSIHVPLILEEEDGLFYMYVMAIGAVMSYTVNCVTIFIPIDR